WVNLRMISQRETVIDGQGKEQPAIKWYLDVVTAGLTGDPSLAREYQLFRIENDQLRGQLELPLREGLRYSYREIEREQGQLGKWADAAEAEGRQAAARPVRHQGARTRGADRDVPQPVHRQGPARDPAARRPGLGVDGRAVREGRPGGGPRGAGH